MMKRIADATVLALLLGSTACTVGPDFTPPQAIDTPGWNDASAKQGPVSPSMDPDPEWWTGFNDPVLTALIEKAIKGNLDLQQAVLRVIEAHQGEVSARAEGLQSAKTFMDWVRTEAEVFKTTRSVPKLEQPS